MRSIRSKISLALLAPFVAGIVLASCQSGGAGTATQTTAGGTTAASQTETTRLQPNVPVVDYQGYDFRVADRSAQTVHWASRDIYAEAETGDTINDAVYKRNMTIQQKYNITVSEVPSLQTDQYSVISKSIKAGSDDFDIIEAGLSGCNEQLAQVGMLHDLAALPNLGLTMPWWDQNANSSLSIEGKLYSTTSDLTIVDKDATWAVLFDKAMIQNYGLDDPYTLVQNGQWTMDRMYTMMKAVSKDLDGDGKMTDKDQYGLVSENGNTIFFYNGAGQKIATKDADDIPQISLLTDPTGAAVVDQAYTIQTDKQNTILAESWAASYPNNTVWDGMANIFSDGHALFYMTGLNRVTILRGMQTDFGILPVPKYADTQAGYYDPVSPGSATAIAFPQTITDINRTTVITEALTAESMYTLLPAYYDISLQGKLVRDTESGAMLDLIFANRLYDIGMIYNWGNLSTLLGSLSTQKSDNIVSAVAKAMNAANAALQKTLSQYQANAG